MSVVMPTRGEASSAPLVDEQPTFITFRTSTLETFPTETIVYQNPHVAVTTQRLIIGTKTFDLATINAAEVRALPIRKTPLIGMLISGVFVGGWFLTSWSIVAGLILCAIVLCIVGLVRAIRPNYVLRLVTDSGATDVLMSLDRNHIIRTHTAVAENLTKQKA